MIKLKKSAVIIGFSLVIIAYYLASYYINSDLFAKSSEAFVFFKAASRRGRCLNNSYTFFVEYIA